VSADRGPGIDLHSHAGRCFLAGLPARHSLVAAMGPAAVADAVRAARAEGMTALVLAAVADFAVLRPDSATGLRAHRDFRPGEAYADYRRQLAGIRQAVAEAGAEVATSAAGLTVLTLVHYRVSEIGDVQTEAPVHDGLSRFGRDVVAECNRLGIVVDCAHASFATTMAVLAASSQPVIISHGQLSHPGIAHPRLMTAQHAAAVAEAGGLVGAWPCGITSRSLADFGTETIRLVEAAGPGHVALGTDLDGNYRPVLTGYDQLDDLTGLLAARGLPMARIHQILGGNAMKLLGRVL
jgi:membrane dipeptidase